MWAVTSRLVPGGPSKGNPGLKIPRVTSIRKPFQDRCYTAEAVLGPPWRQCLKPRNHLGVKTLLRGCGSGKKGYASDSTDRQTRQENRLASAGTASLLPTCFLTTTLLVWISDLKRTIKLQSRNINRSITLEKTTFPH